MSITELSHWTGVNRESLHVLVNRWRGPSWLLVLKRRLPDGSLGYVLGSRGRLWLEKCPLFIPEHIRDSWLQEIVDHQQRMFAEEARQREQLAADEAVIEARLAYYNEHGEWPW